MSRNFKSRNPRYQYWYGSLSRLISMAATFYGVGSLGDYLCLAGPSNCGKSSLLFQHAVTCAERGRPVLFISPHPLEQLPLLNGNTTFPSQQALNRIHFKYPSTLSALQEMFDRAHLPGGFHQVSSGASKEPACLVIIDDFHQYFTPLQHKGQEVTAALARTCAHIVDAIHFLIGAEQMSSSSSPPDSRTMCIISLTHTQQLATINLGIVKRWFPTMLTITETGRNRFSVEHFNQEHQLQPPLFSYQIHSTHFDTVTV